MDVEREGGTHLALYIDNFELNYFLRCFLQLQLQKTIMIFYIFRCLKVGTIRLALINKSVYLKLNLPNHSPSYVF